MHWHRARGELLDLLSHFFYRITQGSPSVACDMFITVTSRFLTADVPPVLSGFLKAAIGSDTVPPTSPAQVQPKSILTSTGLVKVCEYIE
jgi:hypothetical protein